MTQKSKYIAPSITVYEIELQSVLCSSNPENGSGSNGFDNSLEGVTDDDNPSPGFGGSFRSSPWE